MASARSSNRGPRRLRLHPPSATRGATRSARLRKKRAPRVPLLEAFSQGIARRTGSSVAFIVALAFIVVWASTGPIFGFSDTWQLVVNTATTVVTFLMVFLIQRAQNKDTHAIELKLDELLAAVRGASNAMVDIEELSEKDLANLQKDYRKLAQRARRGSSIADAESKSIEEVRG